MPYIARAAGTLSRMSESPEPSGDDAIRQLRAELALVAADAQAARTLAAGADRDVSEVRAELRSHTRVLNALRETQVEQGRALADLRVEMRAGFATLATGMADITRLLRPGTDD